MTEQGNPIGTAPVDGTEFLAYDPVSQKFDVCAWREGKWYGWANDTPRIFQTQFETDYGPDEDDFRAERATLWWPLPEVTDEQPASDDLPQWIKEWEASKYEKAQDACRAYQAKVLLAMLKALDEAPRGDARWLAGWEAAMRHARKA